MDKAVFLTRGELHIHSINTLSIYLKPTDKRWNDVHDMLIEDKLKIVTINPLHEGFYRIIKDTWYAIQSLEYVDSSEVEGGYIHAAFKYKFDSPYAPDDRTKNMTLTEISKFKETMTI